jgi:hypothetical protein
VTGFEAFTTEPTLTKTRTALGPTVPEIRPNETSRGAGATIAGGRSAGPATALGMNAAWASQAMGITSSA